MVLNLREFHHQASPNVAFESNRFNAVMSRAVREMANRRLSSREFLIFAYCLPNRISVHCLHNATGVGRRVARTFSDTSVVTLDEELTDQDRLKYKTYLHAEYRTEFNLPYTTVFQSFLGLWKAVAYMKWKCPHYSYEVTPNRQVSLPPRLGLSIPTSRVFFSGISDVVLISDLAVLWDLETADERES